MSNPFSSIGLVHIPRTGGSYTSKKLGIAFFEARKFPRLRFGWWHHPPEPCLLAVKNIWFTIIRNPYDRILSEMKMHKIDSKALADMKIPDGGHFCRQVTLAKYASSICRYESLPSDLNRFLAANGYPGVDMSDFRQSTHNISESDKAAIFEKYREDFIEFGYPQ